MHPTNPISPKRIKNATKIVKSIEVVLKARAKRWIAKRSEGDPLVEAAGMRRTGGLETPAESRAGAHPSPTG